MENLLLTNSNGHLNVNNHFVNPVGCIISYAGNTAPPGWLICNGSEISKNTYSTLFSIIGNNYGISQNSNNFVLPNLMNKFSLGKSETNNLGDIGGNENITLSENQLPSHSHTGTTTTNGSHTHSINDPGHTHTQTTINDDFNNSGNNPPGFQADSAGSMTWYNINNSTTGISINENGSHNHTFTTNMTGLGSSINIINPYIVLNYIIKY